MSLESLLILCLVGGIAGWLAALLLRGRGLGILGNIVVGILGAFVWTLWFLYQRAQAKPVSYKTAAPETLANNQHHQGTGDPQLRVPEQRPDQRDQDGEDQHPRHQRAGDPVSQTSTLALLGLGLLDQLHDRRHRVVRARRGDASGSEREEA